MSEFNPASDLPTTSEQLEQVRAVAIAEYEWDSVGGPLVDSLLKHETSVFVVADKLCDLYGVTQSFWREHLMGVMEDNGVVLTGCSKCGSRRHLTEDCRTVPARRPHRPAGSGA